MALEIRTLMDPSGILVTSSRKKKKTKESWTYPGWCVAESYCF